MEPLGPLRVDAIFADLPRNLDNNRATLAKKGREMPCSAVANKTLTPNAASNALANIYIKGLWRNSRLLRMMTRESRLWEISPSQDGTDVGYLQKECHCAYSQGEFVFGL